MSFKTLRECIVKEIIRLNKKHDNVCELPNWFLKKMFVNTKDSLVLQIYETLIRYDQVKSDMNS